MQFVFNGTYPKLEQGKRYDLKEIGETRTDRQNRAIWGYYYQEALEAFRIKGIIMTKEQVHFLFKRLFLRKRKKCQYTKRYYTEDGSTTSLSTKDFNKYIEKIKLWVFDNLQYDIQDPDDQAMLAYYDNFN